MNKIYEVDLVKIDQPEIMAENLEVLLNQKVEAGFILDRIEEMDGNWFVITINPPEPEMAMMTPGGPIPIIGS